VPGDRASAEARITELTAEIRRHDDLYYGKDAPEIADVEYDALVRELEVLETAWPDLVRDDSPTRRVGGAPVPHLESVAHRRPMLSLANTYSRDEVVDWSESVTDFFSGKAGDIDFSIEPKLDGVAIELVYERGALARAITRGDGRVGDDVTHTARTIRGLPRRLTTEDPPELLEVRGEVLMTHDSFAAVNRAREAAGEATFVNPRNLASGTLKMLDPSVAASRPLDFVAYGLGEVEGLEADGHRAAMERLAGLGLPTAGGLAAVGTLDEVMAHHDDLLDRRESLPFDVDGTVVKVDRFELQQRLGERSKSPRWAIAFKFPSQRSTSVVRQIDVQVGRTGALTPRAVIEPVHVGGVTIEHVTLHNGDEIARLGVKVGDRVLVERAGDVIPKILEVTESGDGPPFTMPDGCPACGTPAVKAEDEVVLRCPNRGCPAVLHRRVEHFVSRGAMDVEGMGEKLIALLVGRGLVKGLADLYALDQEALAELPRMGEVSAANVVGGLEESKTRPFARLLYGLGIRHVGEHVAQVVAREWPTVEALRSADAEQLEDVAEIGPVVAESLVQWLADEEEQRQLDLMTERGVAPSAPAPEGSADGPLAGRTFLFTGALQELSRREANELVKAAGGRLLSGVSRNLDVLVVGEKPGSKLAKARELGVEVMDEQAFLALVRGR